MVSRIYWVKAKDGAQVILDWEWSISNVEASWKSTKVILTRQVIEHPIQTIKYAVIAAGIYEVVRYIVVLIFKLFSWTS